MLATLVTAVAVVVVFRLATHEELFNQLEAKLQQAVDADPKGHVSVSETVRRFVPIGISLAEATARLEQSGFRFQKANPGAVQPGFDARYVGRKTSNVAWQVVVYYEYEIVFEVLKGNVEDVWGQAVRRAM